MYPAHLGANTHLGASPDMAEQLHRSPALTVPALSKSNRKDNAGSASTPPPLTQGRGQLLERKYRRRTLVSPPHPPLSQRCLSAARKWRGNEPWPPTPTPTPAPTPLALALALSPTLQVAQPAVRELHAHGEAEVAQPLQLQPHDGQRTVGELQRVGGHGGAWGFTVEEHMEGWREARRQRPSPKTASVWSESCG